MLPLQAASLSRYEALAPGVGAYPVLRRTASVPGAGTTVLSPTVLGLPAAAIAKLHWRSDFSSLSPGAIASRLGAGGTVALQGAPIPPAARELTLHVRIRGRSGAAPGRGRERHARPGQASARRAGARELDAEDGPSAGPVAEAGRSR